MPDMRGEISRLSDSRLALLYMRLFDLGWNEEEKLPLTSHPKAMEHRFKRSAMDMVSQEVVRRGYGTLNLSGLVTPEDSRDFGDRGQR